MATFSQGSIVRPFPGFAGRNGLLDRYFYFAMSLLVAAIVVWGFSHSINENLFHAAIPRPVLLWIHGAAFSGWVAFYIFQSALVRTKNLRWHRFFGWFGAALGAAMVGLGFTTAIIMTRFDAAQLHRPYPTFLSVPFFDMTAFGVFLALAIRWRRQPEMHRRLLLLATCTLLDAPFGRIDFIFNNCLFFACVDGVILLGVLRDMVVTRSVHKVYLIALPTLMVCQGFVVYLWRGSPAWWLHFTEGIMG
jgi:hypothetical protein